MIMKRLASYLLLALIAFGSSWINAAEVFTDLSWTAPTTRTDTTPLPLTEIGGYRVYESTDGTNYTLLQDINSAAAVSYTAAYDLPIVTSPYTYYYALTAYDTDGRESAYSEVVSKTFLLSSTADPSAPGGFAGSVRCGQGCSVTEVIQ